jgi:type IV pilus assembly protein PilM
MKKFKDLTKFCIPEEILKDRIRVGLDIGAYSIKFVQLKDTPKGPTVIKLGYKEIPQTRQSEDSETNRGSSIASLIRELWQEQKMKTRRVSLVISDPTIYSRHINIPQLPEEELMKAIKWQAEKYIPFSLDDAIVDFQTLDSTFEKEQGQMEIVIVAAKKESIYNYIDILKFAKVSPTLVDVTAFAIAKLFWKNYSINKEELVAIIDIGANITSIIIFKGNDLQFVRNLGLAGNNFTQAIAEDLHVDFIEAEKMKKESSIYLLESESKKERYGAVSRAVRPVLEQLVEQIKLSFAYCEREFLIQAVDNVILCGGNARFKGLDRFLMEKLGVKVELVNPFRNIAITQTVFEFLNLKEISPVLTAALGAVLS